MSETPEQKAARKAMEKLELQFTDPFVASGTNCCMCYRRPDAGERITIAKMSTGGSNFNFKLCQKCIDIGLRFLDKEEALSVVKVAKNKQDQLVIVEVKVSLAKEKQADKVAREQRQAIEEKLSDPLVMMGSVCCVCGVKRTRKESKTAVIDFGSPDEKNQKFISMQEPLVLKMCDDCSGKGLNFQADNKTERMNVVDSLGRVVMSLDFNNIAKQGGM